MALSHDREYEDGEGFFQPPTSIWEQIKEKLHPSEIQEVSSILGQSLIDKNKELHDEIKSLLMILEDYVKEVDQREKQRNWNVQLGRDSNKDFLASEIRDFISALRSQTSTPISLRPKSAKDRSVLSFVMPDCYHEDELPSARKLLSSRGQSRGGRDGQASQEERNRPMTADLLGSLTRQAAAEHDKFSLETVECLSERFREILSLEEKDLLDQIDFLHSCIEAEQERDNKNMCTDMLPTERDLKDLRDRLQVELSITAAESRKQMRSKTLFPLARSLKPVSDLPAPPLAPPLPLPVPPFNQLEGPTQDTPGPPPPIPRAELGIDSDEERFSVRRRFRGGRGRECEGGSSRGGEEEQCGHPCARSRRGAAGGRGSSTRGGESSVPTGRDRAACSAAAWRASDGDAGREHDIIRRQRAAGGGGKEQTKFGKEPTQATDRGRESQRGARIVLERRGGGRRGGRGRSGCGRRKRKGRRKCSNSSKGCETR